jgi:hypothetical protein
MAAVFAEVNPYFPQITAENTGRAAGRDGPVHAVSTQQENGCFLR